MHLRGGISFLGFTNNGVSNEPFPSVLEPFKIAKFQTKHPVCKNQNLSQHISHIWSSFSLLHQSRNRNFKVNDNLKSFDKSNESFKIHSGF